MGRMSSKLSGPFDLWSDEMEIDWEISARLQSDHLINMDHRKMPTMDGTLRDCVLTAVHWPGDSIPTIFLDRRVMGKTILNKSDIQELARMLGEIA
jgi:hypothetical protein